MRRFVNIPALIQPVLSVAPIIHVSFFHPLRLTDLHPSDLSKRNIEQNRRAACRDKAAAINRGRHSSVLSRRRIFQANEPYPSRFKERASFLLCLSRDATLLSCFALRCALLLADFFESLARVAEIKLNHINGESGARGAAHRCHRAS